MTENELKFLAYIYYTNYRGLEWSDKRMLLINKDGIKKILDSYGIVHYDRERKIFVRKQ